MKMQDKGFTMIEMMLVIIMMGILAAMVVPNLSGRSKQARIMAARVEMEANLATALDLYELDVGHYPTTQEGLASLVYQEDRSGEPINWNGPYLKKRKVPVDPWGRDYGYVSPGENNIYGYDLFSLGPDGIESKDDIKNWE